MTNTVYKWNPTISEDRKEYIMKLLQRVDRDMSILQNALGTIQEEEPENFEKIVKDCAYSEAKNSSAIEWYTMPEVFHSHETSKYDYIRQAISNIEWLLSHKISDLSLVKEKGLQQYLSDIHKEMEYRMNELEQTNKTVGMFRTWFVSVGSTDFMGNYNPKYIAPKPTEISQMSLSIEQYLLESEIDRNELLWHPVIQAILFSTEFVQMHPFDDGNGRTSRLLLQKHIESMYKQEGKKWCVIPISEKIMELRSWYYFALEETEEKVMDIFHNRDEGLTIKDVYPDYTKYFELTDFEPVIIYMLKRIIEAIQQVGYVIETHTDWYVFNLGWLPGTKERFPGEFEDID